MKEEFKSKNGRLEAMSEWRFPLSHCASGFRSGNGRVNKQNGQNTDIEYLDPFTQSVLVKMSGVEYIQFMKLIRNKDD